MRQALIWLTWLFAAFGLFALTHRVGAETACPPGALGVSRIIEIDTTGGPWFGTPRGDPTFLAPGEVVLTFDDGPTPKYTRPILSALAAHCTKATFFMLGEMAAEYPDLVKEVAAQGHTIGGHTWGLSPLQPQSYGKRLFGYTLDASPGGPLLAALLR